MKEHRTIPLIDISALMKNGDSMAVAQQIRKACVDHGFFYVCGHGITMELQNELEQQSRNFFGLPLVEKMKMAMSLGGKAWRGYFPVGEELTSGKPDQKEGIYFGTELSNDHPKVMQGTALHGKNLFPKQLPQLEPTVLAYMDAVEKVGHAVMRGVALSLDLPIDHFEKSITRDPFILFRIFHYPAQETRPDVWGVGEHTDYGLLTILKQDAVGGLQVKSNGVWIEAPPIDNTFICNIGDMLDRMTGGLYRSTPHRVLNTSGKDRLSFPLFFDPGFDAVVERIGDGNEQPHLDDTRWDKANVYDFKGKYGEYLTQKVARVFPALFQEL